VKYLDFFHDRVRKEFDDISDFIALLIYQQDQTVCIKFTHRPKIVVPIHVKFGIVEGHVGLLGHAKFHANWCPGWEHSPKMAKISTFW